MTATGPAALARKAAYKKKWRRDNRKRLAAYNKQYRADRPGVAAGWQREYRARRATREAV
jgi:hypothetical protein